MLLVINIGNTNITLGLQTSTTLLTYRILTKECNTSMKIEQEIENFITKQSFLLQQISDCIISSVVPDKSPLVSDAVRKLIKTQPILVSPRMDFGVDISSYDSSLIGTDRLLCCMASYEKFKTPFIVYDLGTATTANIVNENRLFLGGAIIPGLDIGLGALAQNTALIPKVAASSYIPLIGKNTNECLLSGAIHGTAGFIDSYTDKINEELGNKVTVIITGGNAPRVIPFLKADTIYCPDLLLEGLILLYSKYKL